ncbi:MAG: pyruvate kinase alpha/beta domain-containing protein [Syntrophomonadaceae bacterium]|jgi:hypothetical protein
MYWTTAGPINTDNTIKLALERAKETGISYLVVASCSGQTASRVLEAKPDGLNIVAVTHHVGFAGPGVDEMPEKVRADLIRANVKILTTTHLFAGVDRAIRNQFGGVYPAEIMAQTLRIFGQGVKVAVEIGVMALDAGLIPYGEDIISLGGTAEGVDAAIIMRPAHSNQFFKTEVREIICMPASKSKG